MSAGSVGIAITVYGISKRNTVLLLSTIIENRKCIFSNITYKSGMKREEIWRTSLK